MLCHETGCPPSQLSALHTCRHVGLLTIEVLEARGLKKYDILGKSDPFIELSTQPLSKEKTSVKKKTLTPHWNETKHVLVQVRPAVIPPDAGLGVVMCWWLTHADGTQKCKTTRLSSVCLATQEPSTQFLRVEMYDHDLFQPKVIAGLLILMHCVSWYAVHQHSAGVHAAPSAAAAAASMYQCADPEL